MTSEFTLPRLRVATYNVHGCVGMAEEGERSKSKVNGSNQRFLEIKLLTIRNGQHCRPSRYSETAQLSPESPAHCGIYFSSQSLIVDTDFAEFVS